MRRGLLITTGLLFLTAGCATEHRVAYTEPTALPPQQDAVATALAFDPPITSDQAPLMLDREPRRPSAFVGYQDPVTTFSYLRTDDRVTSDNQGRYERRAISERFDMTTR